MLKIWNYAFVGAAFPCLQSLLVGFTLSSKTNGEHVHSPPIHAGRAYRPFGLTVQNIDDYGYSWDSMCCLLKRWQ